MRHDERNWIKISVFLNVESFQFTQRMSKVSQDSLYSAIIVTKWLEYKAKEKQEYEEEKVHIQRITLTKVNWGLTQSCM